MNDGKKLMKELGARGVTRAKIGGFDIDGVLRGKYVSLDKLRSALKGGFGFCDVIFGWDIGDVLYDNAKVTGWHTGYPDVHAVLDPSTLRYSPWEPATACLLADFRDETGGPHPACPRSLLRSVAQRAEAMGYRPQMSLEYEFFMFRETPASLEAKGFVDPTPLSPGMFGYSWVREGQHRELMADIFQQSQAFDIDIEGLHTETGPGVYEVAIRYDDVLRAADKAALFKVAMKQIAHEHGLSVTFMAKWKADLPGCGGHIHQSLWREGKNAFADPSEPDGMSETFRHYVGGLVALLPDLCALFAPNVNSYKRYVPGIWAPVTATWGVENRTAGLRVIGGGTPSARVECRQPGADVNPYLGMAASLGAGLYGIQNRIDPPSPVRGDAAGEASSPVAMPRTLGRAVDALMASEAAREILGEGFVDHYARTRDWEVRQFERSVTDWELKRYFEAV